jgi:hypothetical protein
VPTAANLGRSIIIQDDRFDATASVTVVSFSTSPVEAPLLRLPVQPSDTTGLGHSTVGASLRYQHIVNGRDAEIAAALSALAAKPKLAVVADEPA